MVLRKNRVFIYLNGTGLLNQRRREAGDLRIYISLEGN